ncbi:MAG: nuclear transport factor 2 family protein [Litorimonas sp.]
MARTKRVSLIALAVIATSCNHSGPIDTDREDVLAILAALDDRSLSVEAQLENYREDAVILAPNEPEFRGTDAIREHLSGFGEGVEILTRHEIVNFDRFEDLIAVQGRVIGTAQPEGDTTIYEFETKNLILFRPTEKTGDLKIWKVIYNAAPASTDS